MQITLNIDASQLQDEVAKTLESMSEESKQDLAKQAVLKYIEAPVSNPGVWKAKSLVDFLKEKGSDTCYIRSDYRKFTSLSEEEVFNSNEYLRWMNDPTRKTKYSLDGMLTQDLIKITADECNKQIKALVDSNPVVQDTIARVIEDFKTNLPKYIEAAMTLHFTKTLGAAFSDAAQALQDSYSNSNQVQEMNQRLLNKGIY